MVRLPAPQRNAAPYLRCESYREAATIALATAAGQPPLLSARWLTGWSPDAPVLAVAGAAAARTERPRFRCSPESGFIASSVLIVGLSPLLSLFRRTDWL